MMKCIFLCIICFTMGAKLPDDIKRCSKSGPKKEECLKDAFEIAVKKFLNGYKPLGMPTLEPMTISEMTCAGSGGMTQIYRDMKIHGTSNCTVTDIRFDVDELIMNLRAICPHTEMRADYNLKGKMVTFPIDSSGKCEILMDGVLVMHNTTLERFEKGGKKYVRVKDWKMKLVPSKVHFYYENVMPGNKQLSETILKTMNENGVQIFLEQAPAFEEGYAVIHKIIANKVLEKIPEDELFLP